MKMRHTWQRTGILLLLAILAIPLFSGNLLAQEEKVLVVGHAESTDSLDPARGYTQTTGMINRINYNTLVTFPDQDASSIEPMLATEWSVSEDGLQYTFALRDDVVFSNGDPMTSSDVVFSITRLKNVLGSPSFLTNNISEVTADGDYSVIFTLAAPDPAFLARLTNYAFSVTNAQQVMDAGGTDADDAATTDDAEAFLNSASVGTGPYMLDLWDPQVRTEVVRNPNYWGDAPYFDRIILVNIQEPATQKVALESGEIDLATDLTADQIVTMGDNPDISIYSGPTVIDHFLLMNQDPEIGGPVSDPMVQLAIRYALDYEGYKTLFTGTTPASWPATGIYGALGEEYAFTRDLDRAKELLTEAGYPDGFEITLDYPTFSFQGVNMETNAQKIQADLAEAGITVTLRPGELQVALEEYRLGQQGFAYWFWGPDVLDPIDALSFLPDGKVGGERANWTSENADAEILELRDRASVESDPQARLEIFQQIQEYLQQSGPWAPFLQPDIQVAFRSDIQGYIWHPAWNHDLAILSRAE
ncbi:MAG: ABC transporter substrate-binding protein [Anaerolineae bacterium]|nr:ABC transporter substrate-binding protein [Anaerolineae bacterium]